MPDPVTQEQRYRDTAAECRKRASLTNSSKQREAFEMLARHYDEMAEVARLNFLAEALVQQKHNGVSETGS
jgi:hypothetical protein